MTSSVAFSLDTIPSESRLGNQTKLPTYTYTWRKGLCSISRSLRIPSTHVIYLMIFFTKICREHHIATDEKQKVGAMKTKLNYYKASQHIPMQQQNKSLLSKVRSDPERCLQSGINSS